MKEYKIKVSYRVTRYQIVTVYEANEDEAREQARLLVEENTQDADIISVSTIVDKKAVKESK